MTEPLAIAVVGRRPEYLAWVMNSWILSSEHDNALRADRRVHTTYEHALIERYWKDPGFTWLFAVNPDDTNFCYGYLCGEATDVGPVLHYVYVRRRMRDSRTLGLGVANTLLQQFTRGQDTARITYTRSTPAGRRFIARQAAGTEWFSNPYLAFSEFAPWRP